MKRELFVLCALVVLLIGTHVNVLALQEVSDQILACTRQSAVRAESGDWAAAGEAVAQAKAVLIDHDAYLHVVLRHEEINALRETLSALEQAVAYRDAQQVYEQAQLALLRTENLLRRERVTLGSVF